MNVITFPAPPKDFDPVTASHKSLTRFGIPRRPDPNTEPGLRKLWDKVFARKPTFLTAELEEDEVRQSRPRSAGQKDQSGPDTGANWAGVVVEVSSLELLEPANMIFAEWTVPKIRTHPAEPGAQQVSIWVGLGGYFGSTQVLQAGTGAQIKGKSVVYKAWTEWSPRRTHFANLAVEAGDVVGVLVCAPKPDRGFVAMVNKRTNTAISVGVSHPKGTKSYDGSTFEWIVEQTTSELPNFGSVTFSKLTAGTESSAIDITDIIDNAMFQNIEAIIHGQPTILAAGRLTPQNDVEVIWKNSGAS